MSLASHLHVPGIDVLVGGAPLDPKYRNSLVEIRVTDSLALPGSALIRISDPKGEELDSHPLQLGKDLEIKASAMGDRSTASIFKGQVVALEPEFEEGVVTIVVRALQKSHKLFSKRQSRTFQDTKASDMAKKVITENGLSVGTVDDTTTVHKYFHQAAETDWEFLNRIAVDNDREVVAEDGRLHFRQAGVGSGTPTTLKWGADLISFRPRMTAIQQTQSVEVRGWDAAGKQAIVGNAQLQQAHSQPGKAPSDVIQAVGTSPKVLIAGRTVDSVAAANALAKSAVTRLADSFVEAEGSAYGTPKVRAGTKVKIEGVGSTFGGTYVVTQSTHVYRGGTGYITNFTISGRSARSLLDLVRAPQRRSWSESFVVGVVVNNNDPDQMGRVKVKFPSLGDKHESYWARVVSPSAGPKGRGLFMLPQPDEEVVVGFENGDAQRPYVIGSVFNGKDKPGDDLLQNRDGTFALKSDKKIWMKATEDIEIRSEKGMVVEISKDVTEKTKGDFTSETTGNTKLKGQQVTIEAGGSISIKGVSITVEASGSLTLKGATVTLQGSGPTQIKGQPIQIG